MYTLQQFFGASATSQGSNDIPSHTSLDIITYVASLASDPRAIDSILDNMRSVTSHLKPGEAPNERDNEQLKDAYFQMESYLVQGEPLREFTTDDIREKVAKKIHIGEGGIEAYWQRATTHTEEAPQPLSLPQGKITRIRHTHNLGRAIIGVSLVIGCLGMLLPAVPSPEHPLSNNFNMAFSLGADALLLGAAWLFLKGLSGFTSRLKTVYRLLCVAMVLLALAQSQQAIYTYFGLWSVPFIQHGGVAAGFVPATVLFYIAMVKFARLLQVKGFASSVTVMLIVGGVLAGLSAVLPIPSPLPPEVLKQSLPPSLLLVTVQAFAALSVLAVKRVASPAYTSALAWLFVGLSTVAGTALFYAMLQIFLPPGNAILAYGTISFLFMIAGICLVRSAVAFNLITED